MAPETTTIVTIEATVTTPLQPKFQTYGESHGPDDMAQWTGFSLWART